MSVESEHATASSLEPPGIAGKESNWHELPLACGVTDAEEGESALKPMELCALTVNVYGVPFVRPLTSVELAPEVVSPVQPPHAGVGVSV